MCMIKARVKREAGSRERVAYIKTDEGVDVEVIVSSSQAGKNHIVASEIGRDKGCVLIELPQESSAGDWRVWVKSDQVMSA